MVVVIFGLPGTGKSYFASRLAEKIKAAYISSDKVRFELMKERTYDDEEKMAVYRKMLDMTAQLLEKDNHVVLDGTFYKEELRRAFIEIAGSMKADIFFIEVVAEDMLIQERISKHRQDSEADYMVHMKVKEIFEPMTKRHLILKSTANNIDEMLAIAMLHLAQ